MKTKAQEMDVLQRAIAELGPDSYLGPWLATVVDEVTRDIRSDFLPTCLPSDAHRECDRLLAVCNEQCRDQLARAKQEAEAIRLGAHTFVNALRNRAAASLNECWRQLTS